MNILRFTTFLRKKMKHLLKLFSEEEERFVLHKRGVLSCRAQVKKDTWVEKTLWDFSVN